MVSATRPKINSQELHELDSNEYGVVGGFRSSPLTSKLIEEIVLLQNFYLSVEKLDEEVKVYSLLKNGEDKRSQSTTRSWLTLYVFFLLLHVRKIRPDNRK